MYIFYLRVVGLLYLYLNVNSKRMGCYGMFFIVIVVEFFLNVIIGCNWNLVYYIIFIFILENVKKFFVVNFMLRLILLYCI